MKLTRGLTAAGLLGAVSLAQQLKKNAGELVRVQTATLYLKSVEILRDLFLYQIGILVCVVVLVFGIILIQGAVAFFIPLSAKARLVTVLTMGFLDSSIALGVLAYFASSRRWLKQAAKYNECLEELVEKRQN